jgi:hypothetical protein
MMCFKVGKKNFGANIIIFLSLGVFKGGHNVGIPIDANLPKCCTNNGTFRFIRKKQ